MRHFDEARRLRQAYVPASGPPETLQGELLRGVETLRDEAQRNGNADWGAGHEGMACMVRDTLIQSGLFGADARSEIQSDAAQLLDSEHPVTSDDPYDRLTDRIVEWSRAQPGPLPTRREPPPAA